MSTTLSRRRLFEASGSALLAAGVGAKALSPRPSRARSKTLKILQWKHFVPSYDEWFNESYVQEWGERNDTEVIVHNVGLGDIHARALEEVNAQQGHDLVLFLTPPTAFQDHVIDHREIYQECRRQHGETPDFIDRATYNLRIGKSFAFCSAYSPALITYRRSLWDSAPIDWEDVRDGGRRIKLLHDKAVGVSLAAEHNAEHTLRAIMYSFGSSEQSSAGSPALKSRETLEAVKYVKLLYEQAMRPEVLDWDATSNNRFMLSGDGCLTLDTLSIARASESLDLPLASDLTLVETPAGPEARLSPSFSFYTYVIWNFAENIAGATQFLVDFIAVSREAFFASGFQNMPAFPGSVPDLRELVWREPVAVPLNKYSVLAEASEWTTNLGHPGYTTAAIAEIFTAGVIPTMFARAATGQFTPEEALDQADREVRRIFQERRA